MGHVQDALFSTKNVTEEYLAARFPEVAAPEFYRELFPSGSLEKRGEYVEGKYCAIAVRVGEDRAYRYSITDDLETVSELIRTDDFDFSIVPKQHYDLEKSAFGVQPDSEFSLRVVII